jgi:hypothetical protein
MGGRFIIERSAVSPGSEVVTMKQALALVAILSSTAAHGQAGPDGGAPTPESTARLGRWSVCQREFITPLLQSRRPVPEVVSGAHDACRREEEALRQALVAAHGPAQAGSLMTMMKEATDRIMCGLLRAVRQRRDGMETGAMTFETAEECLRGDVRISPGNPGGAAAGPE